MKSSNKLKREMWKVPTFWSEILSLKLSQNFGSENRTFSNLSQENLTFINVIVDFPKHRWSKELEILNWESNHTNFEYTKIKILSFDQNTKTPLQKQLRNKKRRMYSTNEVKESVTTQLLILIWGPYYLKENKTFFKKNEK